MPLELPDGDQFLVDDGRGVSFRFGDRVRYSVNHWKDAMLELVARLRRLKLFKITLVHWIILITWMLLLLHFTSVYRTLYRSSALLATMCTNVLLFGTSDCLAQVISCLLAYKVDPVPNIVDKAARTFMSGFSSQSEDDLFSDIEEDASVFNDYGPQDISARLSLEREGHGAAEWDADDRQDPYLDIFNFYRWICFMFWGLFLSFFQVPWYKFLNYFYTEDPTVVQVLERVLSDQLVYSPISLYSFFMYSNYIMEHGDGETFQTKIKNIYISTLGCNYLVWPMVQFINFLLVPKHLQVPFSSSVGVLWNCFLSMRNSSHSV